ncbi:ribonuclease P protein component [Telmatospirillum sp.]|uniref:ribonuclease P protein component n=1 Tax=Telmatospirillum sp. TaxID=2079197 RepID=UPI00284EE9B8|nr:ribonuclease P protein component [Telmatospirillum sp.]MDR3439208.1 ribonuclease P protein component [Telmatospirillum sp.]
MIGRLKRRPEFLRVAGLRCKWATPGLILQAAPTALMSQLPPSVTDTAVVVQKDEQPAGAMLRVGFTCSKKVGNSVARNRARRRLRAVAAEILPVHGTPGYDYVLIGRQETLRRPFALLLQDLQTALKRVGSPRNGSSGAKSHGRQDGPEAP